MAYTILQNGPQNFVLYDPMYPHESSSYSGSSAASSPHFLSPSPPMPNLDLSDLYKDHPLLQHHLEIDVGSWPITLDSSVPMCIDPSNLHAPNGYGSPFATDDCHPDIAEPVSGHDELSSHREHLQTMQTSQDSVHPNMVGPDAFPMKKDRERGNANLVRSSNDPDRHHGCTMCIRKFKRRADLARHLKRHQGIRQYECTSASCPLAPPDRWFFRADARQRHWKAHPKCEDEFLQTEAGAEWAKKNKNRSQKTRGTSRRNTILSRSNSLDSADYDDNDYDDADYHD
ncbi:hypothetical protein FRC17_006250 [Serendipita sp. 399]|nr:hypothetical protein FRC17_006250 [Serendipita sp. 399]